MTGVLEGIRVLDLSWGISGPLTGMLLADHGADVTKIEPPDGDPFRDLSGYRVWQRGKRNAALDLDAAADHACFLDLARTADVVLESFAPGTTARLGIDHDQLARDNAGLVTCSITGYGASGALADRPGYDALVAARTGQLWEIRGVPGTTPLQLAGIPDPLAEVPFPPEVVVGPDRAGPLFPGVPWASMAAAHLALLGISAALRAREVTGRGQWVQTSLLQGVLATTVYSWQRTEHAGEPGFTSWVLDPRSAKGTFRCADGRWIHQWTPLPSFFLGSTVGDRLEQTDAVTAPKNATARIGLELDETVSLMGLYDSMAAAAARFPSDEWTSFAAEVGVPLQPVRSPEEALADPAFHADGCVVQIADPELGPIREIGEVYRLSACPVSIERPPAMPGEHTDELRAEARAARARPQVNRTSPLASPLAGLKVVELGLAIAAPFTAQLLAELGADVVKVQQPHEAFWMGTHFGMSCNRGKRSLAIDLHAEGGADVFRRLTESADVVVTNMRAPALTRLHADYDELRARNPRLVYCHMRGFERGTRDALPGVDQTGAALCGSEWLDGALDHEHGAPVWALTSLGDTGAGFLAAIGIVQALYHRERTGEGQYVDTSIVYAHLLNCSMAWSASDGSEHAGRPTLDPDQLGWSARYRMYETADGWLCVAALTDAHWTALCAVIGRPDLVADDRRTHRWVPDASLTAELAAAFAGDTAAAWFERLDRAGVPCEIASPVAAAAILDDPSLRARGWTTTYDHAIRGRVETAGHLIDFSETPGVIERPSPQAGEHTTEILGELGYDTETIVRLAQAGVVADPAMPVAADQPS